MTAEETKPISTETDPHRWIAALRAAQNELVSIVEPLTPEQLEQPSYHSWTITEVLSHLGSQAEIFYGWLEAAVSHSEPAPQESFQAIWDAWSARTPEQTEKDALSYNERSVRRYESLSDEELAHLHLSLFGMEIDAARLAQMRLSEVTLHIWDIEVALDPTARLLPGSVDLIVDALALTAQFAGKPRGKSFRLHVRTSGPERDFLLEVGDAVRISAWNGEQVDGELRIPAEAFVRLVYGRHEAEHMPRVEITAPDLTLDDVRAVFPGV
jgi:uncharacterized protein (TIGR03083 family)